MDKDTHATSEINDNIKTGDKLKICVSGASDTGACGIKAFDIGKQLGAEVAKRHDILLVGAMQGFPAWVAIGAKEAGGMVIGFSPAENKAEHEEVFELPVEHIDHMIYTGFGISGCNVMLTRASDAVLIGCGKLGSVNEFTVAYAEHKPIGILRGEWKTDEIIEDIIERSNLDVDKIALDTDPKALLDKVYDFIYELKVHKKENN